MLERDYLHIHPTIHPVSPPILVSLVGLGLGSGFPLPSLMGEL